MENYIIKSYFKKDELLLDKVLDDYYNYISKIIINIGILSEEDKEEIISDVIFVLWKNKEKLDRTKILTPYIAGITKRIVYKKMNLNYKENTVNFDEYDDISSFNIESIIENKEINDYIIHSLKEYSKIDSKIFEMFYLEEKSIKQISNIMGLSKVNVKTKLHRIRKKVKEILRIGWFKG